MRTMTIGAIGRVFISCIMRLAVAAFKIIPEQFRMTGGAVHGLIGGAGPLKMIGDLGMALGTGNVLMD
jgi:hypothetical protein